MRLAIRLLGAPSLEVDGGPARSPRGRKAWAVLAYVLLAERPPSRQRLATLLFGDADDPLGALRWTLAEIRRALRPHAEIEGDPVELRFADDGPSAVDALDVLGVVATGDASDVELPDGELLEGMEFDGCDAFETWLLVERRRLAGVVEAALHEQALHLLAGGRPAEATGAASRLVARNPLDENFQELLVRCLAAAGERDAAVEQAERCIELFRRELGVEPALSVRRAADTGPGAMSPPPNIGSAGARAQLEAGKAAISAGVVDAGLDCLRRAVLESDASGDGHLHVEALVELGGALVHSVRGRDEEGAAILHEALERSTDHRLTAQASRELAFIDVQAGRRDQADRWLAEAEQAAADDHGELASILGVRGMNLLDRARYAEALETLQRSIDEADLAGARRQHAWSLSMVARIYLETGRQIEARGAINGSLAITQDERWTAFSPWPESIRADIDLVDDEVDTARDRYAHAYALACQLGDPCWEGVSARGLGLVEARAGATTPAMTWLDDAYTRCMRWPDAYQWVRATILDTTCDVSIAADDPRAPAYVEQLAALASRTGMRHLVVRSHVHRARLGQPGALEAAAIGAAAIDNPLLTELVEGTSDAN
jgi:DNA-binding SARP family transcriptional activator